MAADRKGRRWLAAAAVTAGVHLAVFLGLVVGTPRGRIEAQAPVFQVSLERTRPPTPPPKVAAAPRPSAPSPIQLHQPPAVAPNAPSSGLPAGPAPAAPAPATPPSTLPSTPSAKLKLDCLHMGPAARRGVYGREDCEVQKFADPGWRNKQFAIPANPAWDAQVAGRMTKHQPLPPEKPNRNDCANSNLGLGCTDDMLIPLVKKPF
jgi:hypothetical protein